MSLKTVKNIIILLLISIVLLTGCGSFNSQENGDLKEFKAGYLPSTGHLLYFVAKDKGFFEEEGLDVELVLFSENNSMLSAMESGKLDAGAMGSTNSIFYIADGHDISIIGGAMTEGHALVVKQEAGEDYHHGDLTALEGKRIANVPNGTADVVYRQGILDAGLDPDADVELVVVESGSAAFTSLNSNEIDGAVLFTPFRKLAEDAGYVILAYSGEVDGFELHPCCRQVALNSDIEKDPEAYESFLRALIKAYKFYQTEPDETVRIIANYVDVDQDILEAETYGNYISSSPDPDKAATLHFYESMVNLDYIVSFDIENNINTDLYKKALDSIVEQYPDDEIYSRLLESFED